VEQLELLNIEEREDPDCKYIKEIIHRQVTFDKFNPSTVVFALDLIEEKEDPDCKCIKEIIHRQVVFY
jgi:hypothetical protein